MSSSPTQQTLTTIQRWMAQNLRRRRAIERDPESAAEATQLFTGNDRLSPAGQAEVYRQQFWLRHTASLLEDFPGLSGIIGQQHWERLSEEYLTTFLPRSYSLRELGDRMPEHVLSSEWLPHHALCHDMARLEWAYVELFDAKETPPIKPEQIQSVPEDAWDRAQLHFDPSLCFLALNYPVAELRRELRAAAESGEDDGEPIAIPDPEPQWLVLYRSRERVMHWEKVSESAFLLLSELRSGTALVPACEAVMKLRPDEDIEGSLAAWFGRWTTLGWVCDLTLLE